MYVQDMQKKKNQFGGGESHQTHGRHLAGFLGACFLISVKYGNIPPLNGIPTRCLQMTGFDPLNPELPLPRMGRRVKGDA